MKVILIRSRSIDPAVNKIAETLSLNGYDVQLLVWDRQHTLKEKNEETYSTIKFNLKAPYDKPTALLFLPIWWAYELYTLLRYKYDVVHVCDLDTLIPAVLVKIFKNFKLCYTIYDFYANNLSDGSFQPIRKIFRSFVASVEKMGISYANALFLVDESRYEEIAGAKVHNLTFIYNSPVDYFINKPKYYPKNKSDMDILYVGVLAPIRGIDLMINTICDIEGCRLIIGGIGPEKNNIVKLSERCRNVQYIGWLNTYQEVIETTIKSDILFRFSDPKVPKTKYESPNKLFEAMMCSKPIIVSDGSSMANIVRKENCGLVISYGSINDIKNAILTLKNDTQLRKSLGENGRKAYDSKYSWNIMESRILSTYKNIMV